MNATELRAKALEISNKAAIVIAENDTPEKLAEAQRMLDDADAFEARAASLDKIEARQAAYEAAVERLPIEATKVEERSADTAEAVFAKYVRGRATGAEVRAAGISVDEDGGFLVPVGYVPQIIEKMKAYGPMLEGGPVTYWTTESGNKQVFPTGDTTAQKATIIGEGVVIPERDVKFGQKSLSAYKYTTGLIKVSSELFQDSSIDLVGYIQKVFASRWGRGLNEHLTVGTGEGQPEGIVTAATVGHTSASATALSDVDILELYHSLDPAYRANAGFMFNDATFKALRLLKDNQGRMLWQPGLASGSASTILDKPYYINQDMASIASGNATVLFGDLSEYTVRRVGSPRLRRLDERFADTDQVGFVGLMRYDGALMNPDAVKKLVQA